MQIVEIKQKGKSETYYVTFDDGQQITLQLETIVKNHLKENIEINNDRFTEIKIEDEKLTCFSRALKYISSRLKTEKQMREYLYGLNYGKASIDLAIDKLKSYGYINDEYYATTYMTMAGKTKGKRFIKNELLSKGVKADCVENVLEEKESDDDACENVCQKWLKNKTLPLIIKDKEKLYRFLLSRGFEYDTIRHTLNKIQEEEV